MPSPQNGYTQTAATGLSVCGVNYIDSLLGGYKWGGDLGAGVALTYSFPWSSSSSAYWATNPDYSSLDEPSSAFGLDATQRAAARSALAAWGNVAAVTFTEVADTATNVGDIRFAWTTKAQESSTGSAASAWANYPNSYWAVGGDVWLSQPVLGGKDASTWQPGGFCYFDLIHELGHALGLKHTFAEGVVLPIATDSNQYSVMSYTDHPHSLFVRVTQVGAHSWEYHSFDVVPDTPMLYDIAAIQYMYGPNMSYRNGDDVYTFDPSTPFIRTLWDAGGNDTISVSNFSRDCVIDLQAGHFSKIAIPSDTSPAGLNWDIPPPTPTYDGTDNLAIAFGVTIENAIGGSGNDRLVGNNADNTLNGGAGSDIAVYAGQRGSYGVAHSGSGYTVTDNAGTGGIDTLSNIETLQFSDVTVNLTVQSTAASVTRADLNSLIELYVAYFNRVPDAGGLAYWIGQYKGGSSLTQIAQSFYDAGVVFSSVTGYSETMPTSDFIKLIYQNVLGRGPAAGTAPPPDADVNYWVGQLASGAYTKGTLVKKMLSDAHLFTGDATWGWVPSLLDNKVAVGYTFAVEYGLGYVDPNQAISQGMAVAHAVTPTDTSAAIALIGVSDAPLI